MNIDSIQIECFLTAAKYMNFSKAAAELYITQPVLSRRISKLESEIGVTLFDRSQRVLKLTNEGARLYSFFSSVALEFKEVMKDIERDSNILNRKISIGMCEGLDLSVYLTKRSKEKKKINPTAELEFDSVPVDTLIDKFKNGYYSIILIFSNTIEFYKANGAISKINISEFIEANKCVVFSKNNPLSSNKSLSLADFGNQTLYCLKKEHVPQKVLTHSDLLMRYKINPKIQFLSSLDAITMALQMGEGYTISDNHERILNNKDIQYFNLEEKQSISIVSKENPPLLISQFLSLCKNINLKQM